MSAAQVATALTTALLLGSCGSLGARDPVVFASDPPGARVVLDGRDSGFVTPCKLELEGDAVRIDFVYPGYVTATRLVAKDEESAVVLWRDMYLDERVWRFPLWLETVASLRPIYVDKRYEPARLFVRLKRAADG